MPKGQSQIILPTQNFERAYYFDKESEVDLSCLRYEQCAGPKKQEVINGHRSNIVWQKIKVKNFFE